MFVYLKIPINDLVTVSSSSYSILGMCIIFRLFLVLNKMGTTSHLLELNVKQDVFSCVGFLSLVVGMLFTEAEGRHYNSI